MAHYTQRDLHSDARAILGFYESGDDPEYAAGYFEDLTYAQAKAATRRAITLNFYKGEEQAEWWGDFLYTIRWNILHLDR